MKIVFLISGFNGGGAEKQCLFLLRALNDIGVSVKVIYFEEGEYKELLKNTDVDKVQLNKKTFYSPKNIFKVYKELKKEPFDILFTWLPLCDIYGFFLKLVFLKKKWISAERDSNYRRSIKNNTRLLLAKFSDGIIANSEKGKLFWEDRKYKEKLFFIPNIVGDYTLGSVSKNDDKREKVLLYVGRFQEKKKVIELTKTLLALLKSRKDIKIKMIGAGDLMPLVLKMVGDKRNFEVLDFQEKIYDFYQNADIFLSFSAFEGMPNTLIESVSFDALPIVSSIDEHKFIVGENYKFIVDDINDIDRNVTLISQAIDSLDEKEVLISFAKDKIRDYSPDKIAESYKKRFLEILHSN